MVTYLNFICLFKLFKICLLPGASGWMAQAMKICNWVKIQEQSRWAVGSPPARTAAGLVGSSLSPDVSRAALFDDSRPKPGGIGWPLWFSSCRGNWAWLSSGPGFAGGASGKEPACQRWRCKRGGFSPWVGTIPWKGMTAHPSILAWRIPWTEEPGGLQSRGLQRARLSRLKRLSTHTCKLRAMAPRPESDLCGYRSYRIDWRTETWVAPPGTMWLECTHKKARFQDPSKRKSEIPFTES